METLNNNKTKRNFAIGILLIVFGVTLVAENLGAYIPFWVLSWHTLMLAIGLAIGYRKNFKSGGWIALVVIGDLFTLQSIASISLTPYTGALLFIGLGLYLIFKPKKDNHFCGFGSGNEKFHYQDFHGEAK